MDKGYINVTLELSTFFEKPQQTRRCLENGNKKVI